jgi:hypothetical protein
MEDPEKVNIVLEVQNGTISAESLFGYVDKNLNKGENEDGES